MIDEVLILGIGTAAKSKVDAALEINPMVAEPFWYSK